MLGPSWKIQPGLYALVGATALLGGIFRSAISLVVIMVEGTGGINFMFEIIVAVVVANMVGSIFHFHGIYEQELEHNETMRFLPEEPPRMLTWVSAKTVMKSPVVRAHGRPPFYQRVFSLHLGLDSLSERA